MLDFLQGWLIYPFSEAVHALQGVLVGWLAARAIFKKETSDALVALLVMGGFCVYEITEQWKINDSAYQDIENFWLSAIAIGILFSIWHLWKRRKNRSE